MSGTRIEGNSNAGGWYSVDGDATCSEASGAGGSGARVIASGEDHAKDLCENERTAPPYICSGQEYDPLGALELERQAQFNDGHGPTRKLDPAYARRQGAQCVAEAKAEHKECMKAAQADAETMCTSDIDFPGTYPDGRPVKPGDERDCVEQRMYGKNAGSVSDATSESTTEQSQASRAEKNGGGGKAKVILGKVVELEGQGAREVTNTDQTTSGTSNGSGHTKTENMRERRGTAEPCITTYEQERDRCRGVIIP